MANTLICLPPEIVHNILKHVEPIDLARIAKTCRMLHRSIVQDRLLCKEVWCAWLVSIRLSHLSLICSQWTVLIETQDEPKRTGLAKGKGNEGKEFDFEHDLHEFVRVQRILENERSEVEDKVRLPPLPLVPCHTDMHPGSSTSNRLLLHHQTPPNRLRERLKEHRGVEEVV